MERICENCKHFAHACKTDYCDIDEETVRSENAACNWFDPKEEPVQDRCHYIRDEETGERVLIPGCMGVAAHYSDEHPLIWCTCSKEPTTEERLAILENDLKAQIKQLKEQIDQLKKQIEK